MKSIIKTPRRVSVLLALLASALAIAPAAKAVTFSFSEITTNSPINVAGQLVVDVTDVGGMANFHFTNNVGLASSITDVYFQAAFAPPPLISSSAGVSFGTPATPGALPGENAVGFVTTLNLSADSNPPAAANGINAAGEFLDLRFAYGSYGNLNGVLTAIGNGSLRIGLHVQALSDGQSESYVNNPPTEIPGVPDGGTTVAMFGVVLMFLAFVRRQLA